MQRGVYVLTKLIEPSEPCLVGAGYGIHHTGVHASLLVMCADITGQAQRRLAHSFRTCKCLSTEDAGAAFGVQRDQLKAGLDVLADMLD
ncbi:hypothetical protein D9M71_824250 [compost metagenome]